MPCPKAGRLTAGRVLFRSFWRSAAPSGGWGKGSAVGTADPPFPPLPENPSHQFEISNSLAINKITPALTI